MSSDYTCANCGKCWKCCPTHKCSCANCDEYGVGITDMCDYCSPNPVYCDLCSSCYDHCTGHSCWCCGTTVWATNTCGNCSNTSVCSYCNRCYECCNGIENHYCSTCSGNGYTECTANWTTNGNYQNQDCSYCGGGTLHCEYYCTGGCGGTLWECAECYTSFGSHSTVTCWSCGGSGYISFRTANNIPNQTIGSTNKKYCPSKVMGEYEVILKED